MTTIKADYTFENGVIVEFVLQKNDKNPIASCKWSCEMTKENINPLLDEYATKCVPKIYQEIANFTCQSIMWVDSGGKYSPRTFQPNNLN